MHNNLQPGQYLADRYRVVQLRAGDAFGGFWDAVDTHFDAPVTLRTIQASLGLQADEISAATAPVRERLDHPALVAVDAIFRAGNLCVLVATPIRGKSLREFCRLRPDNVLDPKDLEALVTTAVDLFDQAHDSRLIHGGLRQENIFLDGAGSVQFADFGLGGLLTRASLRTKERRDLGAVTPYISRTLARGQGPYLTDDIFAFGTVLYVCLTGATPWQPVKRAWWSRPETPRTPAMVNERRALLRSRPAPVPSAWEQITLRCVDRDGFARPQRFGVIGQVLAPSLSRSGAASRPTPVEVSAMASAPRPQARRTPQPVLREQDARRQHSEPVQVGQSTQPRPNKARPSDSLADEFWSLDRIAGLTSGPPKRSPPAARTPRIEAGAAPPGSRSTSPFLLRFAVVLIVGGLLGLAIYFGAYEYQRRMGETAGRVETERPSPVPADPVRNDTVAKQAPTGTLTIRTIPIGATVQIGSRPPETGPVFAEDLPEGAVSVRVTASGYQSRRVEAEVVAGALRNVDVTLEREANPPAGEAAPSAASAASVAPLPVEPGDAAARRATPDSPAESPGDRSSPAPGTEADDEADSAPAQRQSAKAGAATSLSTPFKADPSTNHSPPAAAPAGKRASDSASGEPDSAAPPAAVPALPPANEPGGPGVDSDRQGASDAVAEAKAGAAAQQPKARLAQEVAVPGAVATARDEAAAATPPVGKPGRPLAEEGASVAAVPPAPAGAPARPESPIAKIEDSDTHDEATAAEPSAPTVPPSPPSARSPELDRLHTFSEVETKPVLLRRQEPDPPRRFRRKDGVGTVRLSVIIDRDGFISAVRVAEATDDRLAQACIAALRGWRFKPAQVQGQPVAVRVEVPFVFK